MMAYSTKFWEAVTGADGSTKAIDEVVMDFMQAYTDGFNVLVDEITGKWMDTKNPDMMNLDAKLRNLLAMVAGIEFSWEKFIGTMLFSYDDTIEGMLATTPKNPNFAGKKVGFTLAIAGSSYINDDGLDWEGLWGALIDCCRPTPQASGTL